MQDRGILLLHLHVHHADLNWLRPSEGNVKKVVVVAVLLVSLSTSVIAAPRGDDSPGATNPMQRIVQVMKHFLTSILGDGNLPTPPHP